MPGNLISCPDCGRRNRPTAHYCGSCGILLADSAQTQLQSPLDQRGELSSGSTLDGGQYRIIRRLGRGGFGEAYLAEDTRLARPCVVKRLLLNPRWDATVARQVGASFEREARLLVELNNPGHPNIPEIYAYLPESRCLVMKFITGTSLLRLLKSRIDPLPEAEALRYVRDACAALVYMHNRKPEPVLHRDIKPDNLMLDEIGRIWLIDFGLARALPPGLFSGSAEHSQPAGTLGYTPPEQWRGQAEPRSDVFALAATLYELLSGRRPLPTDTGFPTLRSLNPAVRPQVEALVLSGMAAEIEQRPTATTFLAELEALLAASDIPEPPAPARPPYLSAGGREAELAAVAARLAECGHLALTGMAGVGKTTLATLAAQRHGLKQVFWHTFCEGEGAETLVWALAGWLYHQGHPLLWQQLQRTRRSGVDSAPELLAESLVQVLLDRGYLLCLDDLHLVADDPALGRVIERLRTAAGAGGAKLLLLARTSLSFITAGEALPLHGLAPEAAQALLAEYRSDLADELFTRIYSLTEGNPQFLNLAGDALRHAANPAALVDRLVESGDIERYLLQQVDERLSDNEREVMTAVAALLGHGGSRDAIEALLEGANIRRILAGLNLRHLLTVEQRANGSFYHQHAILRSFYYAMASRRERQGLHRRAADYYATEERDLLLAARHALLGGEEERAVRLLAEEPWSLIGSGQARAAIELMHALPPGKRDPALDTALWTAQGELAALLGTYEEARTLLEQALAGTPASATNLVRLARRQRLLAQVYERTGAYEQALNAAQRGLELAAAPGAQRTETARLYAQQAEIYLRQGLLDQAEASCREGLASLPTEPAAPAERANLLQRLATVEARRGTYATATETLERSLGLARQSGDLLLVAAILNNIGTNLYNSGQLDQALLRYQESLELKERLGDLAGRITTLSNLGLIYQSRGDSTVALRCFDECAELSSRTQLRDVLAFTLRNIGFLHYESGAYAVAQENFTRAHTIFTELGEVIDQAQCLYMLGDVALAEGNPEAALAYGRQALVLAHRMSSLVIESCGLRVVGEALLANGDLAAAAGALERAWALQEQIGDPYDQALTLAARARLALACDRRDEAVTLAGQSRDMARDQAMPALEEQMAALIMGIQQE